VINNSAQQHGHVLIKKTAQSCFNSLNSGDKEQTEDLQTKLSDIFSVPFARIWKTSCTSKYTTAIRNALGREKLIEITGSDAPWRFSAFGIMKTAADYPQQFEQTEVIHQINSLIAAVLSAKLHIPLDYGNACGTSLMDYRKKAWSQPILQEIAKYLSIDEDEFKSKLPALASAKTLVGKIARYFVHKYGFDPDCAIAIGSGDNPQTKVLVSGSLLSLGSGFVNMVETDGQKIDYRGFTNAMYDGFDRPLIFGCRTNGALLWDKVRAIHGIAKKDYEPCEQALKKTALGNNNRFFVWNDIDEALPPCRSFSPLRVGYETPSLEADYTGVIESVLSSMYLNCRYFMPDSKRIYATSGPASSPQIIRRLSAIWNKEVIIVKGASAALGAAVSGAYAVLQAEGESIEPSTFALEFLEESQPVKPLPEDVKVYHAPGGFLEKYQAIEKQLVEKYKFS
jgi:xylulokinase